jgi:hypothetical protein
MFGRLRNDEAEAASTKKAATDKPVAAWDYL